MNTQVKKEEQKGPNLQALGLKNAMEVLDILGLVSVDGQPVITDDNAHFDPKLKAKLIMEYFYQNFDIKPNELPYLASLVKHDLKHKKIGWGQ